jgi:glycosyltransferase involved in cell wall biosynthesis
LRHNPSITVITVVYNGKQHLEETIQSVLAQTYENMSYIIIDGGSTDGSVDIIRRYQDKISNWVSEKDLGIYDAMNKGWAAAADDSYVLFLGAGDRLISLPSNMQNHASADVIYGKVRIGEDRIFISKTGPILKLFNTLHHQALLIKKSVHPGTPFDLRYTVYADFDFNQRLLKQGAAFTYAEDLVGYAMPGGLSSTYAVRESFDVVRRNFGLMMSIFFLVLYAGSAISSFFFKSKPFSSLRRR